MYTIINQSVPLAEDCAALVQSFHQLAMKFVPTDTTTPYDTRRILELVRPLFGYLYQQSDVKYKRDLAGTFPFLESFENHSLLCSITHEPVVEPVELPDKGGIMEYSLAKEYVDGRLRMTKPIALHMLDNRANTDLTRLALLAGGNF